MVTSIEVDNVSKRFSLHYTRTLQQIMVAKAKGKTTRETFSALNGVSFDVQQGEAIGLMGLNVGVISNAAAPFGGVKQSGLGREGGAEGLHEYTTTQYIGVENPWAGVPVPGAGTPA